MLAYISFYFWWMTIVPLFFTLLRPIYKVDVTWLMDYVIHRVLQIKVDIQSEDPLIEKGFILANHRSWADFCLDQYTARASILGRRLAFYSVWCLTLFFRSENRCVAFVRGKDSRRDIYEKCVKHIQKSEYKRIVIFPEGTRLSYTTLNSADDVKKYLKYGLLKEIYCDARFPVQIMISSNKEVVFNEKTMTINYGVQVKTHISKPIWPNDFKTDTEFYDAIACQWYKSWKNTHDIV